MTSCGFHPYNSYEITVDNYVDFPTANFSGGFICVTSGTITVTRTDTDTGLVAFFPVTAGQVYRWDIPVGERGCQVSCAGGASGHALIN